MYYQAHIGLVDAHTEGIGSHHDTLLVVVPLLLAQILYCMFESGMIEGSADIVLLYQFAYLLGASATAHIYYGAAMCRLEYVYQFLFLIACVAHYIGEVLALETHAEDILLAKSEPVLYVVYHLRCCCGGECQYGYIGFQRTYVSDVQIGRAEVVAPLRYTVSLIDSDEADFHVLKLCLEQFGTNTFGRHIQQFGVAEYAVVKCAQYLTATHS